MRWTIYRERNTDNNITIRYSYEDDDSCDGVIVYDRKTEEFSIIKLSSSADKFVTEWLCGLLYGVLNDDSYTEKKRVICVG